MFEPDKDPAQAAMEWRHASMPSREDVRGRLMRRYAELREVDEALQEAEARLDAAHSLRPAQEDSRKTQELYQEVLALRARSRRMLQDLADIWVSEG
jgi:hypothetical protein